MQFVYTLFPYPWAFSSVFQIDVHLENGQRVYFDHDDGSERVENPENTTLTVFFKLCQENSLVKTLLYEGVSSYYTFDKLFKILILN